MAVMVVKYLAVLFAMLLCCFTGILLVTIWRGATRAASSVFDYRMCALIWMVFWFFAAFIVARLHSLFS